MEGENEGLNVTMGVFLVRHLQRDTECQRVGIRRAPRYFPHCCNVGEVGSR